MVAPRLRIHRDTIRPIPPAAYLFVCLTLGCVADLKRVHTPDLLDVDERQARKYQREMTPTDLAAVECHPVWQLHSSLESPTAMTDNDLKTAAFAAAPERKIQFILVDLGRAYSVKGVAMHHADSDGYPRRYRIDVAGEHNFPYTLQFIGAGTPRLSNARWRKAVRCRFLRITLLETCEIPWNVAELDVY